MAEPVPPAASPDDWPRVRMAGGGVELVIAQPDDVSGYYRGPRFEAAGMIVSLRFANHEFASDNFTGSRDPEAHDHISGTAEEFAEPLGYEEVAPGQPFIKIGVGLFEKPSAGDYFFANSYRAIQRFAWKTQFASNRLDCVQAVDTPLGWSYVYRKSVILLPGDHRVIIEHNLKNTGERHISSTQYGHHFFLVDRQPPDGGYEIEYGLVPELLNPAAPSHFAADGRMLRPLDTTPFCTLIGGCRSGADNVVRIRRRDAGAEIEIRETTAPARQALYISKLGICPESFVRIDLAPGESHTWSREYTLKVIP